jgi:hypothetical protein
MFCLTTLSVFNIIYSRWETNDLFVCSIGVITLTGKNQSTWRKTCPSSVLSTINPTWTSLGSDTGLCGDRLVINHNSLVFQLKFNM